MPSCRNWQLTVHRKLKEQKKRLKIRSNNNKTPQYDTKLKSVRISFYVQHKININWRFFFQLWNTFILIPKNFRRWHLVYTIIFLSRCCLFLQYFLLLEMCGYVLFLKNSMLNSSLQNIHNEFKQAKVFNNKVVVRW